MAAVLAAGPGEQHGGRVMNTPTMKVRVERNGRAGDLLAPSARLVRWETTIDADAAPIRAGDVDAGLAELLLSPAEEK
jgi:hypothetical protein